MLVNDIEKMKAEFAAKLDLAEKENALNEGIEGYVLSLTPLVKIKADGCTHSVSMRIPYEWYGEFRDMTYSQVADVLDRFPMTQDTLYDKTYSLPYVIHTNRSYGDRYGVLTIGWISGVYEMRAVLRLEDSLIKEFLDCRLRHTTSTENSTYTSIHVDRAYERPCVPEYPFKKEHRSYYGGTKLLTDREEILRIIDFIKNYKA